jgi:adenylyltransferase/sulfurtransferase
MKIIEGYDIIVDCSDNFDTRYLLNDACVLSGKPLVYGAIYQYEGQVGVWNIKHGNTFSSNYRDLFSSVDDSSIPNCADGGVIPTVGGIIGCMQASEVIKYVTGIGELLQNKLLIFDTLSMQNYTVSLPIHSSVKIEAFGWDRTEVMTIGTEDFVSAQNDEKYQIIDVRSREEHNSFSLGGVNIPLDEFMKRETKLDPSKSTIFYCRTDNRSAQAAKKAARDNPNARIFVLSGGVEAFRK